MAGLLSPILGAAGTAALQRTFLLEASTFNLVPRILMVFDAVTEEVPEYSTEITDNPVEDGIEVTDHMQLKPGKLSIKGTISGSPIDLEVAIANLIAGGISAVTSAQFRDNVLNSGVQNASGVAGANLLSGAAAFGGDAISGAIDSIARAALLDCYERKARFDVVTKRQRYTNMGIETMRFPRGPATGNQLLFELELKQIRIVSPLQVKISSVAENVVTSAVPQSDLGNQVGRGVSAQTTSGFNKSWLRSLVSGVRGG